MFADIPHWLTVFYKAKLKVRAVVFFVFCFVFITLGFKAELTLMILKNDSPITGYIGFTFFCFCMSLGVVSQYRHSLK